MFDRFDWMFRWFSSACNMNVSIFNILRSGYMWKCIRYVSPHQLWENRVCCVSLCVCLGLYACVGVGLHKSSVSPSKATSRSVWMCEASSLQTQPMGVRLKEGRERMSACRVGRGSSSSLAVLSSGSSNVNNLEALLKPPNGIAILSREQKQKHWKKGGREDAKKKDCIILNPQVSHQLFNLCKWNWETYTQYTFSLLLFQRLS